MGEIDICRVKEPNTTSISFEYSGLMFDRHKFHKIVYDNYNITHLEFDFNLFVEDLTNEQIRIMIKELNNPELKSYSVCDELKLLLKLCSTNLLTETYKVALNSLKEEVVKRFINN